MTKHTRRNLIFGGMVTLCALVLASAPLLTQGANQFASPLFETQWSGIERTIPNFWGPLETARQGQQEPYVEGSYNGQSGVRLVQYFDKARMEQLTSNNNSVTNGLLTVELKSGNLQLGDNSFQQRAPASIGIAGDPGTPGPTYAALGQLPERAAQVNGSLSLGYDPATNTFLPVAASTDPQTAFVAYIADPAGRFGQNVPKAFVDYLNTIPGGYLSAMGYPISAAFGTMVKVGGVDRFVMVQAFERRVLTYTPTNPDAFKVEFGNIGRHYYQWRYEGVPVPVTATPIVTVMPTATTIPTSTIGPTVNPIPPTRPAVGDPTLAPPTPAATPMPNVNPVPPRAPAP